MFERLSETFAGVYKKLSGRGSISESNVREAMEDVRTALLEADVNHEVIDTFIQQVVDDSIGRQVTKSLEPGQEIIGIVHRRLVELLGGSAAQAKEAAELTALGVPAPMAVPLAAEPGILSVSPGPTIVMMCGLQGSGKTTTCGKLAAYLKKRGRSVMLAAADLQRPAAVEQLQTVAAQVESDFPGGARVTFYSEPDKVAAYGKAVGVAVGVCQRAVEAARKQGIDTVILDTAGRLHVNDELMGELQSIARLVQPHQRFLVVDAMTGQDAINSAKAFHERLEVDGIILTKFDSDTRGGAALSVKHVTGAPIKFIGVGEKLDAIEEFHAERMAGRILGMGDVVSLVEKAQEQVSQEEAERLQEKLAKGEMTMEDFLGQLKALRRMGPLKHLLGMIPGVGAALKDAQVDDKQLDKIEAMINSMTRKERDKPEIIDNSRRRRIAKGSGTKQEDVSQLVTRFGMLSKITRQMAGMSAASKVKAVKQLGAANAGMGGLPGFGKGSTRTVSVKDRFKKRKK
jgi:signal recognition particle subunit SRP54